MKKIVIIGANSFQNPLILKAKEMGYETHVFAWKDGSIGERTRLFLSHQHCGKGSNLRRMPEDPAGCGSNHSI